MFHRWHLAYLRNVFSEFYNTVILLDEDWVDLENFFIREMRIRFPCFFKYFKRWMLFSRRFLIIKPLSFLTGFWDSFVMLRAGSFSMAWSRVILNLLRVLQALCNSKHSHCLAMSDCSSILLASFTIYFLFRHILVIELVYVIVRHLLSEQKCKLYSIIVIKFIEHKL